MKALLALLLVLAAPAAAHNVIASVFPAGRQIEGEIGFSNGSAAEDQLVEVFDGAGGKLGEVMTDGEGFFLYTPERPVTHVFRANMGAGHVAETVMEAPAIAEILGLQAVREAPAAAPQGAATGLQSAEVAEMLRTELRPLRQEIAALKTKTDVQSVLGGLGYIAGLLGLGFYLTARRHLAGKG